LPRNAPLRPASLVSQLPRQVPPFPGRRKRPPHEEHRVTAKPQSALLSPLQTARQLAAEFALSAVERDERGGTPRPSAMPCATAACWR